MHLHRTRTVPRRANDRVTVLPPYRAWACGPLSFALALLAGCDGAQSALNPQGPVAESLAQTWWVLLTGAAVILALVMALALYAVFRAHDRRARVTPLALIVGGGVVFPVVVLSVLLLYGFQVSGTTRPPGAEDALRIDVVGHQWWWEVRYDGEGAVTANEIHIPVGRTIEVRVTSADVIHSFWVPSLAGKIDMMPGSTNVQWLRADRPGVFRGQCAEFCGAQHARMALLVIAEPEADFERWRAHQRRDAVAPATAERTQGFAAFAKLGCPECHTVRGLAPGGRVGPDLTHVARRYTLAGATLGNNRPTLAAWVADAPAFKPGTRMPSFRHVDAKTRASLVAFLEGLD